MTAKPLYPYPTSGEPGPILSWARSLVQKLADVASAPTVVATGTVKPWIGAVPIGWLACDNSVKLRADYPALFKEIGTTFNTGGETGLQFRLPNGTASLPFTGAVWIIKT